MILDTIIDNKKIEIVDSKRNCPVESLISFISKRPPAKDFYESIKPNGKISIIAEIKHASPSKGILRQDFNPVKIAKSYFASGACALSVLTDSKFFKGSLNHLRDIKSVIDMPVLRKDFIIDPYQIYETRAYGADALLLIASILNPRKLCKLLEQTHSLGMNAIVEVHNEKDLEKALTAESKIIGINNRDLKTFEVNLDTSINLSKFIPEGKLVISESGMGTAEDLRMLKNHGIEIFLIGETFIKADDPGKALSKMIRESG